MSYSDEYWISIFKNIYLKYGDISKEILEKENIGRGIYQNRFHGSENIKTLLGVKVLSINYEENIIDLIKELGEKTSIKELLKRGVSESTILHLGGLTCLLQKAGVASNDFIKKKKRKEDILCRVRAIGYVSREIAEQLDIDKELLSSIFSRSLKNLAKEAGVKYLSDVELNSIRLEETYGEKGDGTIRGWYLQAFRIYHSSFNKERFTWPIFKSFASKRKYFPKTSPQNYGLSFDKLLLDIGIKRDNTSMQNSWLSFFEENFFQLEREVRFDSCRNPLTNAKLAFDGYSKEHNLLVEFQDSSHYYPIGRFGGKEGLERRLKRDKIKVDWAKKNGIKLFVCEGAEGFDINYIKENLLKLGITYGKC